MKKNIITFLLLVCAVNFTIQAYKYDYNFIDTSVAQALVNIHRQHPELKISFIYDELEDYKVNAKIRADNPVDAVRQLVSYNPISVIADSMHIYVEAMQRGKFRYTGRAVDEKGNAIPFASVILLTAKDSTLITYGITDDNGKFLIPCDRKNVLAKLSGIGYKTTYHRCGSFDVGDIIMPANTINLKGVTVTAENILMTPDKMVVMVGNNVKKHSYDGYSALALLKVPGVDVDVFKGSVSADNMAVLLCINGIEAERDEIKTVNPKDIMRVEYYNNFDPAHPTANRVIDFIVKVRETGGAVMLQDDQHLNMASGSAMVDWRMFRKKSEFGIRVKPGFDHFNPKVGEQSREILSFESGDIVRNIRALPSSINSNDISNKLTYLQRFDHSALIAAVSYSYSHDKSRKNSEIHYPGDSRLDDISGTDNHTDQSSVSYKVVYSHRLRNKGSFELSLNGGFTHTDNSRDYFADKTFLSTTKEDYLRISPRMRISIPIGKIFTPYLSAFHATDHSSMNYRENNLETPSKLTFNQTLVETGTNMNINGKLSLTVRFQERITTNDAGYGKHTSSYFTPGFSLSYKLPHNRQLYSSCFWGVANPIFSVYTTDEKRIDEYLVRVGNPDLKIQKCFSGDLSLSGSRKRLRYQLYSRYFKLSRALYTDYTCDNERGVYIQSFKNGGNYETFDLNANGSYSIIPNILYMGGMVQYKFNKVHTYKPIEEHGVPMSVNLDFMHEGFVGGVKCRFPFKSLTQLGEYIHHGVQMDINVGYNINGWSFNLYATNPFMKTCDKVMMDFPGVSKINRTYRPRRDYNFFALRIGYRFNYGKKHKFENVNVDEGANSAILEH